MKRILYVIMMLIFSTGNAQHSAFTEEVKKTIRKDIQEATIHAWNGYVKYATGSDDLKPLTKSGKNWYNQPMMMTPIDAYDTFIMLGLTKEASEAKKMILSLKDFNLNNDVQVFEVTIRILGGLLSAYEMDGNVRFLQLAADLGDRLMPAFNTPTGMPYRYIHLQSGKTRDHINNPAEVGTLLLEFGKLSSVTGNDKYFKAAKKAIMYIYKNRSRLDLAGEKIDVLTGKWTSERSHISGYIDSYYEYLYKGWLLFGDREFKNAFDTHQKAILKHLVHKTSKGWFFHQVDMHTGQVLSTKYGALDAFYAGLCSLAGDSSSALNIQNANYYMWQKFKMEPEEFDFIADTITSAYYILRPENIESCFYLYRSTKNEDYLKMVNQMISDIIKYCKTDDAFASIKNVGTMEKMNSMESFFFAETLKYAYLLFSPDSAADLNKIVFNTEAHPFKIVSKK